jgi:radical SAM superfamily enzyme YgiQ (UPF0313 family)
MARYVFVADPSLSREYNNVPLMDFLPSAPTKIVPGAVYAFLKGRRTPDVNGRAVLAPYALRKLEAALLARNRREDVVIAHEDFAADFIKDDTEIIGVYTMDPLGLGPLTMSFSLLFGGRTKAWVRVEFERLIRKLSMAKRGKKAKLVVGGPGVWELTMMPGVMEELGIDYAFQGEADDIINEVLEEISAGTIYDKGYFQGYQFFDSGFHKTWVAHDRFVTRVRTGKQFPTLDDIPLIQGPTVKGLTEVMRGCGIGCDFCEVALRPIRYYTPEMVKKEVEVNARHGKTQAWLHSDEIFAYKHGPHFTPNAEAIMELFGAAMSVKGIIYANPTHGRISIPAAYPDLVKQISSVVQAGPDKWMGVQVGLETGSERLALEHMPNKTLPLKIGPDGPWQHMVGEGLKSMNRAYWRPAFTVQVGQMDESPEDNWETVAMVNRLSNTEYASGRPAEFTATPMQNVALGLIKSKSYSAQMLDESQLAVYYACYRHLAKMIRRDGVRDSKGGVVRRAAMSATLNLGGWGLLRFIEGICKSRGMDLEKVKRYGLN